MGKKFLPNQSLIIEVPVFALLVYIRLLHEKSSHDFLKTKQNIVVFLWSIVCFERERLVFVLVLQMFRSPNEVLQKTEKSLTIPEQQHNIQPTIVSEKM